jgi:hypothetical protein
MSQITEQLKQASSLEKKAYFSHVKAFSSSMISTLVQGGLSLEKAASLTKEACLKDQKAASLQVNAEAFEKAAEYVEELESKVTELEKVAGQLQTEQDIEQSAPLNKLAAAGFTKEEVTYMNSLPEELLSKVASLGSQPWEMGSAVGVAREKTDPMLDFLLN